METKEEANLSWRLHGDLGESMCALEIAWRLEGSMQTREKLGDRERKH
jgi:hypothetical protein